jgi:uncharacterized protein with von Willebrand factor type A (vWA) domain
MSTAEAGVALGLVRFGRLLRRGGVRVGPDQLIRYQRAIGVLDAGHGGGAAARGGADLQDLYWAGRACLITARADLEAYDRAFAEHFLGEGPSPGAEAPDDDAIDRTERGEGDPPGDAPPVQRERMLPAANDAGAEERAERSRVGERASSVELLRHKAFPVMTPREQERLRELLRRLGPSLPVRTTRRTRPARAGRRLDLRRSVRRSLRTEGDLISRHWRARRTERRTIVLLLDVSGSMASYSHALLQFAYGLSAAGAPVEAFCFGTRLTRVTEALRCRDPETALERAAAKVVDWDGGTRIGESMREFTRTWGLRGFVRQSILLVCSDGLERGDPALLGQQVARLWRLTHRLIWVNPLMGDPDFEPASRGMRAALPWIDELVPGDSFESLAELATRLGRAGTHHR